MKNKGKKSRVSACRAPFYDNKKTLREAARKHKLPRRKFSRRVFAESFRGEFSRSRQTAEPESRGLPVLNKRTAGIARTAGLPDCFAGQSCRQTVFQQPGESRSSKPDKRPKRRRKPVRTEPAKHAGQTRFQKTSSDFPETETGAAEPFAAALFRAVLFPAAAPVTDTTFPSLRETTESHASTKPAS